MLAIVKISLRPVYRGPARVGALSGGAIIGTIMVILIVLAVIVYGVNTTATDTAEHRHVSTPHERKPSTQRD